MIGAAVYRNRPLSAEGLRERLFTLAFSNLVYPQIWEDPAVDLEALALDRESRIVTIASGGCNVLTYLTASPEHITAVDINAAHVALNRLKLAAARHLPDYEPSTASSARPMPAENVEPSSSTSCRISTRKRQPTGKARHGLRRRRRITRFTRNFYRARPARQLHRREPSRGAPERRQSRGDPEGADARRAAPHLRPEFAPLFDRRAVRWLRQPPRLALRARHSARAVQGAGRGAAKAAWRRCSRSAWNASPAASPRRELLRLAGFRPPLCAGGRAAASLSRSGEFRAGAAERAARLGSPRSFTDYLASSPDASLDRYVLLDAQDWMNDADADTGCGSEITRTAGPVLA